MRAVEDVKKSIEKVIVESLETLKSKDLISYHEIPNYTIEVPREKSHGDFASNVSMLMTKEAKKAPRQIADMIVENAKLADTYIDKIEVAGPGFINFYLKNDWLYQVPSAVLDMGDKYGTVNIGNGKKVQVEFVSANPTGLLHMGNARGAALGDSLANLLKAAGYEVTKEYYINDAGNQIEKFGESLDARYRQLLGEEVEFPEDGYHGDDITTSAKAFAAMYGDAYLGIPPKERRETLAEYALFDKLEDIKNSLMKFGVKYDVWFSEKSLYEDEKVEETLNILKEKNYAYDKDDVLWFSNSKFAKPNKKGQVEEVKDEVLIRSNGIPTYFAADIAYHRDKFDRGFHKVINIWGADHHGHVERMKNAVSIFGNDPDSLHVILMQLVRVMRGEEIVRMSKRSGSFITLEELMDEVGVDAARYFFVMRNPDSHLDFDMELAKSQSSDNPVFYVQYAHARICSIIRQAEEMGYTVGNYQDIDFSILKEQSELDLLRKLADLPEEIALSAESMEPHRLTTYLHELASAFHSFYTNCRVLTDEEDLRQARLNLIKSTAVCLRNTLAIIGVAAPTEM